MRPSLETPESTTDGRNARRETCVVEVPELNVADLVIALFIVYGAAVVAVVIGFLRAVRSRSFASRRDSDGGEPSGRARLTLRHSR
jgi:hypothetical protein